ncbi:transcription termination factor 1 [Hyperolius riggenbachi]|uniref:transcription termination factor 1 n=1 Tax=Hyperolius riggenbachi TaxID=752182 RepID=UPI0035A282A3
MKRKLMPEHTFYDGDGDSFLEQIDSDNNQRKKNKKKHHHKDATMEDTLFSEYTGLEESVNKKKKKKDENCEAVGSADNLLTPSTDIFGVLEELAEPDQDSGFNDGKSHKKHKKKKKEVLSEEVLEKAEDGMFETIGSSDEIGQQSPRFRHRFPEHSDFNDGKSHKKHKKKKKKEVLLEEVLENADVMFETIKMLASEEYAGVEASARKKKKKKHRPEDAELEEEVGLSMNGEENVCMSRKKEKTKKRKKEVVLEENPADVEGAELETDVCRSGKKEKKKVSNDVEVSVTKKTTIPEGNNNATENIYQPLEQRNKVEVQKSSKKAKRQDEGLHEASALEDPMCSKNTDEKGSLKHKSKKKPRSSDSLTQTEITLFYGKIKKEHSPQSIKINDSIAEALDDTTEARELENNDLGPEADISPTLRRPRGKRTDRMDMEVQQSDENEGNSVESSQTVPKKDQKGKASSSKSKSEATGINSLVRTRDMQLLEEYFPNIRSLSLKSVKELVNAELERIKMAKSKGILFKTGKFDSAEDELIKKNVKDFLTMTGLESGEMLFHSYKFPQKKEIESLKKKYHFRLRIAEGLYRTTRAVHERGQKLFDSSSHKTCFTVKEIKKLKKHIREHGNSWTTIGVLTGRTNRNVQLKASLLRHKVNKGKWSIEEVNTLIQAVKKCVLGSLKGNKDVDLREMESVPKEKLYREIPWSMIEEEVKTRNWSQCKSKWNDILLLRMNDGITPFDGVLHLHTAIIVITWLQKNIKEDSDQIDWEELGNVIGNVPPGIMQQKIYKLKNRYVPGWQELSFKEIVDLLYTDIMPKLSERLHNSKKKHHYDVELPERKTEFSISDIFGEYIDPEKNQNSTSDYLCKNDDDCDDSD